ncbi:MAG: hypothetical protein FJ225_08495 [Lentisphaerae bacterium]|nr:hypothetical protein [Lentisphaerota bacterium]
MNEDVACRADDLTKVTEGQAWHAGRHGMPGLWALLDGLPAVCRPRLLRGDVSYGNEQTMLEAESRGQGYVFKLRQTPKVRGQIELLERTGEAWSDAGEGWQGTEVPLKLMGWTRARRCVFLRRPAERAPARPALAASREFQFVKVLDQGPCYEYIVLVTNTDMSIGGTSSPGWRNRTGTWQRSLRGRCCCTPSAGWSRPAVARSYD